MTAVRLILAVVGVGTVVLGASGGAHAGDGDYRMFRPPGPGPHPAIVFVSGCSGLRAITRAEGVRAHR